MSDGATWEERMAARARARIKPEWASDPDLQQIRAERMREHPEWYDPTPPDDDLCRECFEWRPYPPGQEHFGYAWWRVCDSRTCKHEHHKEELWLASA